MGFTGKVGGATAEHLLAHGEEVRPLVHNREKASNWANQGVELTGGDWNDQAAIEQALKGVEGAFVMWPSVWARSPDCKEAKGEIANYVEAFTKAAPPRVEAPSSMGANRTCGPGMIKALLLLEQGFRDLTSSIAFVCTGGFFENFLYGLQVAQGGTSGLLRSDKPEIDHGRDERHRHGGRNPFDRAGVVRIAYCRGWFDGHRG